MNISELKSLLEQFSSLNIGELRIKTKELEVELKKETKTSGTVLAQNLGSFAHSTAAQAPSAPILLDSATPASQPSSVVAPAPVTMSPVKAPDVENLHVVSSPLVGTFYRSPAPGQKDYVQVGNTVKKGDVLCIVEAMKVMNTIEADKAGVVAEIVQESGTLVEFGTPLIKIRPA